MFKCSVFILSKQGASFLDNLKIIFWTLPGVKILDAVISPLFKFWTIVATSSPVDRANFSSKELVKISFLAKEARP